MEADFLMQIRSGFSLVEVIVALMLLVVAVTGMEQAAVNMFRRNSASQVKLSASQLAEDRIDLIKLEPIYANLPSYAASETAIPGFPSFERTTVVVQRRDSTFRGVRDYRVVTVRVAAPGLSQPVIRVHSIGAP
jgi:prepilin-type N-terminal cleavage/methylation domain-containing protein